MISQLPVRVKSKKNFAWHLFLFYLFLTENLPLSYRVVVLFVSHPQKFSGYQIEISGKVFPLCDVFPQRWDRFSLVSSIFLIKISPQITQINTDYKKYKKISVICVICGPLFFHKSAVIKIN